MSSSEQLVSAIQNPPAFLLAAATLYLGVFSIFGKIEKTLSDNAKQQLGLWLKREVNKNDDNRFAFLLTDFLNRYFGTNHWTFRCLLRSAILSAIFMFIVTALCGSFNSEVSFMVRQNLRVLGVGFTCFVLTADYFSIGKARWILNSIATTRNDLVIIILILIDMFASIILVYLMLFIFQIFLMTFIELHTWAVIVDSMKGAFRGLGLPFGSRSPDAWFGVFVYSSLFTSIWAVLFGLSILILRNLSRLQLFRVRIMSYFKVEEQPLTIIGTVVASVFFIIFLIIYSFFRLFN